MNKEIKHTPAPWMVEKVKTACGHCFKIGTKEQFKEKKDRPLRIPSYACLYVDYGNAHIQSEANAHLISAAPELLEALELLQDGGYLDDIYPETKEKAMKAIAKAKGGA